jgi:ribonucleoside-diphosphate reductase beta chain
MSNIIKEPLLDPSKKRYTLLPIEYPDIWRYYKLHVSTFWTAEEIDLTDDVNNWDKLNSNEKFFIKRILAFFAASDGIVQENIVERFMKDINCLEVEYFYSFQSTIENIHSETYSIFIDTLVKDEAEKRYLYDAIHTIPTIKKKADWAFKWIQSEDCFGTRLVAFVCIEGIFFQGSFQAIDWLKERKLQFTGLTVANDLISRDEALHKEFGVFLYVNYLQNKLPQAKIHEIVGEAVDIEKEFITESIPCTLLGMNADHMSEYIEFMANRTLVELGYDELYQGAQCRFPIVGNRACDNVGNFFEKRISEYSKTVKLDCNEDTNDDGTFFDPKADF